MILGEVPDTETERLHEFGQAVRKGNITVLNEYLGRLLTLTTALIGGGFAAAKADVLPTWISLPVMCLLFAALAAALNGLRPRERHLDLSVTDTVKKLETDSLAVRYWAARWTTRLFAGAVLLAILGLAVKQIQAAVPTADSAPVTSPH